jgi:hypothetical protein
MRKKGTAKKYSNTQTHRKATSHLLDTQIISRKPGPEFHRENSTRGKLWEKCTQDGIDMEKHVKRKMERMGEKQSTDQTTAFESINKHCNINRKIRMEYGIQWVGRAK